MIAMTLRSVSSLQRVAILFLALSVLCSQSEESKCLKDSRRVDGSCSSFTATLKYSDTFSATLGTTDDSFSGNIDVEIKFGDCKFTVRIYDQYGIKFAVPGVKNSYGKSLSFKSKESQIVSKEDGEKFCSGLPTCSGSCSIPFSWDIKSSSSKIYLNFDAPATLVDPHGSKDLDILTIILIIIWSIILVVVLICVAAIIIYCCKCRKSKNQKAKLEQPKPKTQAKPVKKIDLQEKKSASNEKTREDKTKSDEKAPAKPANFITSKDLASPPKVRKDKAKSTTSLDLKSPIKDKQKSSSQKEKQAPKQDPIPKIKKRTGKSTEATLERVLTSREDEKLAAKEAAKDRAKRIDRDFVTMERVLTTHEEEKLAAKEAMLRAQAKKKTKTTSRDDATIVE